MTLLDLPDVAEAEPDLAAHALFRTDLAAHDLFRDDTGPADMALEVVGTEAVADAPARTRYPRCADGNGTLTHLFFSDDEFDLARAKAICGKCGLAEPCLTGALERAEVYGVWGGHLVIEGVVVAVKRGRGRPPKSPRPPLVVDEVPLPPHLVA